MPPARAALLTAFWAGTLAVAWWAGRAAATPAAHTPASPPQASARQAPVATAHPPTPSSETEPSHLAALRALLDDAQRTGQLPRREIAALALSLPPEAAPEALDLVQRLPEGTRKDALLVQLVDRWATRDPQQALSWADRLPAHDVRQRAVSVALRGWSTLDPVSAFAWVHAHRAETSEQAYQHRLLSVVGGFATNQPEAAYQYALGLQDAPYGDGSTLRQAALETVFTEAFQHARPQQALAWVDAMSPGPQRTSATEALVRAWADADPAAAHAWAATQPPGAVSATTVDNALRRWVAKDARGASKWAATLAEGDPSRSQALYNVVDQWAKYETLPPAEWLNQFPPTQELDRAVVAFTNRVMYQDPAGAMSWAESVVDPALRDWLTQRVAQLWAQRAPAAYEAYMRAPAPAPNQN